MAMNMNLSMKMLMGSVIPFRENNDRSMLIDTKIRNLVFKDACASQGDLDFPFFLAI